MNLEEELIGAVANLTDKYQDETSGRFKKALEIAKEKVFIQELKKIFNSHKRHVENNHDSIDLLGVESFVFSVISAMSVKNLIYEMPRNEFITERDAQISRIKRVINYAESCTGLNPDIHAIKFYSHYHEKGEWLQKGDDDFDFINSLYKLKKISNLLNEYSEHLSRIDLDCEAQNNFFIAPVNLPAEVKPHVVFIRAVTHVFFKMTGFAKYASATRLLNLMYVQDYDEEFGKRHRYKGG